VDPIVDVHITGPNTEWLTEFTRRLVSERLAACGTVTPGLRSLYRWKGEVQDEPEALVTLHTRASLVPALIERTDAEHPYELPGFRYISLQASARYHQWVLDSTQPPTEE
jgi:periplasmic divalent cation tolerance protein